MQTSPSERIEQKAEKLEDIGRTQRLRLPLWLMILGLICLLLATWLDRHPEELGEYLLRMALMLVVGVPLQLLGVLVCGMIFRIGFGTIGEAVIRLIGYLVFLDAVSILGLVWSAGDPFRLSLVGILSCVLMVLLFARLFELEWYEAALSLFVLYLVEWGVLEALRSVLEWDWPEWL